MQNSKLILTILIIIFKLLLDIIFSEFVAEKYKYYGYILEESFLKTLWMWMELMIIIPFLSKLVNTDRFKEKTIAFLILMYFLPGLSVYQYIKIDDEMFILWNLFWWCLILITFCSKIKVYNSFPLIKGKQFSFLIMVIVCAVVIYMSWVHAGLRFVITFTEEYVLRAEERKIELSLIIKYLYAASPVILSISLYVALMFKHFVLGGGIVLLQLLNFSIGGHKTILLMTFAVFGFFLIGKYINEKNRNVVIIFLMILESIFELIFAFIFNSTFLISNISRRVYFAPQILNTFYYEVCSQKGFDYYVHGPARFLGVQSDFDRPLATIISNIYFGTNGNCNNGMFSEAYSNLGWIGCIVLPFIIVFVISFLEVLIRNHGYTVTTMFAFLCAFIWGSGNISVGLLTNGLTLGAIMMFFIPGDKCKNESRIASEKNKQNMHEYSRTRIVSI